MHLADVQYRYHGRRKGATQHKSLSLYATRDAHVISQQKKVRNSQEFLATPHNKVTQMIELQKV